MKLMTHDGWEAWVPETCTHSKAIAAQATKTTDFFLGYIPAERRHRFVDVGAHVGFWSMIMVEHFTNVIAYEPDYENFECLVSNLHGLGVRKHRKAIGSRCGEGKLKHNTSTKLENSGAKHVVEGEDFYIEPLDLYARWTDFLKIDVEGMEADVLRGAESTIKAFSPFISIERNTAASIHYGKDDDEAHNILTDWGYEKIARKFKDHLYRRVS